MAFSTRRTSQDPLVRALVATHRFNLLSAPRENVEVFDLYVGKGREIFPPDRLQSIFASEVQLPNPKLREAFKLPEKTFSNELDVDIVTRLTGKLFGFYGAGSLKGKLNASLKSEGTNSASIRFCDVVRDHVGPIDVHKLISGKELNTASAEYLRGRQMYLVIGVVRAKGIEIVTAAGSKSEAAAEIAVSDIAQRASISAEKKGSGTLVFKGDKHIAFGVELVELSLLAGTSTLTVGGLPPAIDIRNLPQVPSVMLGDPDGPIFVDLPQPSSWLSGTVLMPSAHIYRLRYPRLRGGATSLEIISWDCPRT